MNSLQTPEPFGLCAAAGWSAGAAGGPIPRVLLVDDDLELCRMLQEFLEPEPVQVECVHDGAEAADRLAREAFDLVLLDLMLPRLDGYAVLRGLRERRRPTPVLMLSARGSDDDRIMGLEAGADDYLSKPFNPRELRARLFAMLRRSRAAPAAADAPAPGLRLDALQLDPSRALAAVAGTPVALTAAEARILEALMRAPNRPVSRAQLTRWGLGRVLLPTDRSLDTHVSNLRRKLRLDGRRADLPVLRSARGVGYVLHARPVASAHAPAMA
ncbi:response regulator transcription factor [Pseudorhodoferax sp.]|uniref:response regulator transcription factor n=1 Tax=Pseudorhodoferax sp. TaxID=1993553 RepID=UPI0039E23FCA